jgi:hypothetical protein
MSTLVEKPAVDVQLTTVERVEAILRDASVPVSRNHIHRALKAQHAGTTPARLNRALDYLLARGMAVEGSKGIQWTFSRSQSLKRARAIGRRI